MKLDNLNIDWSQVYIDVDPDDDLEESDDLNEDMQLYNPYIGADAFAEFMVNEPAWLKEPTLKIDTNFLNNITYPELIDINILTFHKRGNFNTSQHYKNSFEFYLSHTQSSNQVHALFTFLLMTIQRQKLECNKSWLIYMIKKFKATENFKNYWNRDCAHIFGKILKLVNNKELEYLPYWYSDYLIQNLDISHYETEEPKKKDIYSHVIKYITTKDNRIWMLKLTFTMLAWHVKAMFPVEEYIERYNILNSQDGKVFTDFLGKCPILAMFENIKIPESIKENIVKTDKNWATSFRYYNDEIQAAIWKMFD